jgi:hypothetical protein
MGWIEDKLALFAKNIDNFADAEVRKTVLEGSEGYNDESDIQELAVWMKGAVERLSSLVDENTAKKIMTHNACRFIEETFLGDTVGELAKLKAVYDKNGDIDEIIRLMNKDRSFNGASMFPKYERKGNVLYNTKKPCRLMEFERAKDRYEKQLYYCFCPFVRATREKIPPVYCNCGAGFNKFIWEEVVEGEVAIEVVESVLDGGECCTFAIYLPE